MIIFDFDKTLTDNDTLFGFYKEANKDSVFFQLKRFILIGFAIASKLKLLNNLQLKKIGIYLFLKGKTQKEIEKTAKDYASIIRLNSIYSTDFLSCPKQERIIISASFEVYLKELFPGENIIGARLAYNQQKVIGIERNMFGKDKPLALQKMDIETFDCLYTDSYSDRPLMDIAGRVYLVENGNKRKIK